MDDAEIVDRIAALSSLAGIPRRELEWLVDHGELRTLEPGAIVAHKGEPIHDLYIILKGHVAIRVDRGAGPRRVMDWRVGDVTGILPYSRMTATPGDTYTEEETEIFVLQKEIFPELTRECPAFTAHTVHVMLDRARNFNTSDLQDEKMISLGKLSAGLAHELNNPASATVRGAKLLLEDLTNADAAARALGAAGLTGEQLAAIERLRSACLAKPMNAVLSPIQQADREDEIVSWLERHDSDTAHAEPLANTAVTIDALDLLSETLSGETLDAALRWIAAGCTTHALAHDIEQAATRIYDLVAAVKKFTYMDNLAGAESVDVEAGLRDTLRVVASKAKSKGIAVVLDIEPDLPMAYATGGELNQVWLNLIDNALDAAPEGGHLQIRANKELDRVVVRVIDDGEGIPDDALPRIFDPFFTTKPPGQGTGLGLDIARRLLRRYHGDIAVDSQPGRTEFRVSLQLEDPGHPPNARA
ncbi:MAG: ATP-binding protein [Gemmatimonadota bacterium]|jgi:signal transduction histidine kinase